MVLGCESDGGVCFFPRLKVFMLIYASTHLVGIHNKKLERGQQTVVQPGISTEFLYQWFQRNQELKIAARRHPKRTKKNDDSKSFVAIFELHPPNSTKTYKPDCLIPL
jgi:hypothetical protein